MESRVRFLGHAVHPQLAVLPPGLLSTAVALDVVNLITDRPTMAMVAWRRMIAAPFGALDWMQIPAGTRAARIGLAHGSAHVRTLLFARSAGLRSDNVIEPGASAHALSFTGVAVSLVAAWLGGERVVRLGVGVRDGARLDASSSLARRPARDTVNAPPWGWRATVCMV